MDEPSNILWGWLMVRGIVDSMRCRECDLLRVDGTRLTRFARLANQQARRSFILMPVNIRA